MSGFKKTGNDLDNLLELWQAGDGFAAATGYKRLGADLNTIYAPASVGTGYTGGTLFKQAGVEIGPRFCAKGQRITALPIDGDHFNAFSSGNVSAAMTASISVKINADGTYSVTCVGNNVTSTPAAGTWLPAGQLASDYEVQFILTTTDTEASGDATFVNSAAAFAPCTANQSIDGSAVVAQLSAQSKGGVYSIAINLRRVSTGTVATTTITENIISVGTG